MTSKPYRHSWPELSEALPVDVMPCSNDEYFPPPPTKQQIAIMELADKETERWRRKFGMTRARFVRTAAATAIGFWAIDVVMGGKFGNYGYARQHRHHRRLRPRVGRPHRPRQPQQPARRVHLRRAVPPRRPRRHVARHEPRDPRVLRGGVAAVVGGHRRPARRARGRLDPRRRRRRDRPDREPLALPLPEGAVPRLRDDDDGPVVRADLARHRQPAAARGGRAHGAHRQRHRPVAALGAARVRDAEPRLRREHHGRDGRAGRSTSTPSSSR